MLHTSKKGFIHRSDWAKPLAFGIRIEAEQKKGSHFNMTNSILENNGSQFYDREFFRF